MVLFCEPGASGVGGGVGFGVGGGVGLGVGGGVGFGVGGGVGIRLGISPDHSCISRLKLPTAATFCLAGLRKVAQTDAMLTAHVHGADAILHLDILSTSF